jgi:hypothetical protein
MHGAMMTIEVSFRYIDDQGAQRNGKINFNGAGTKQTNNMAIRVHKQFLDWAEVNLLNATLVATSARDKISGAEIFRCEYLTPPAEPILSAQSPG